MRFRFYSTFCVVGAASSESCLQGVWLSHSYRPCSCSARLASLGHTYIRAYITGTAYWQGSTSCTRHSRLRQGVKAPSYWASQIHANSNNTQHQAKCDESIRFMPPVWSQPVKQGLAANVSDGRARPSSRIVTKAVSRSSSVRSVLAQLHAQKASRHSRPSHRKGRLSWHKHSPQIERSCTVQRIAYTDAHVCEEP